MENDETAGALAEFAALRNEIDGLGKTQGQFFTFQLTVTGAVLSFAISQRGLAGLLLIVPFISYLLGARYISLEDSQLAIAEYIRVELSRRIPGGLGWEQWWPVHPRRLGRLNAWTVPTLLVFPGSGALSLIWSAFSISGDHIPGLPLAGLLFAWLVGLTVTVLCTYLILAMSLDTFPETMKKPKMDRSTQPVGPSNPSNTASLAPDESV